ncbi:hypothetical protein [Sphingobium sp. AP50]|uniref:hypothetical protein n=1 Tax=Sphingobium sp. AP50 TaxID=1884369 RepID=UPI000B86AF78|nr:hypothetical protein [Sphingobium sp. AP50]
MTKKMRVCAKIIIRMTEVKARLAAMAMPFPIGKLMARGTWPRASFEQTSTPLWIAEPQAAAKP